LAHETFILFPRAIGPGLHDSIIASCQRAGFSPILGQEAPQISSIVHLVAAGFGVSIVPHSIEQIRADGIVYVPIKGEAPRAPISLAVRKDNRSAVIRNFVALARPRLGHQIDQRSPQSFRHNPDMPAVSNDVCFQVQSGKHLLAASISPLTQRRLGNAAKVFG
jgi:hypothetical protein